jgi:hypothetical protein
MMAAAGVDAFNQLTMLCSKAAAVRRDGLLRGEDGDVREMAITHVM